MPLEAEQLTELDVQTSGVRLELSRRLESTVHIRIRRVTHEQGASARRQRAGRCRPGTRHSRRRRKPRGYSRVKREAIRSLNRIDSNRETLPRSGLARLPRQVRDQLRMYGCPLPENYTAPVHLALEATAVKSRSGGHKPNTPTSNSDSVTINQMGDYRLHGLIPMSGCR